MSATDLPPDEERALVEAVLARAPGAFEHLVRHYQGLCWTIINRMVRHPEDTRELCQDAFLRVYRHLHQYRFESPLKSWIGQVAYSVALRHLERKRIPLMDAVERDSRVPMLEQIACDFDLEAASARAEVLAALRTEIESLPPRQRLLLTLYHLNEMSLAEIAGLTGLAQGTIKSHLFRGRARLRERMAVRIGGCG